MSLELSIVEFCSTWSLYLNDKESFFSCACRTGFGIETVYLRLGLEPMWLGLRPSQNLAWDWNPHGWDLNPAQRHGFPTEIIDLVSGPNVAQVLDVSLQKEFSKRQNDR